MELAIINEVIDELEHEETTADNVQELANLYIVREYISLDKSSSEGVSEILDIIPQYRNYCKVKKQYQQKAIPEDGLINSTKLVCAELADFITVLLSNTDCKAERKLFSELLKTMMQKSVQFGAE